MSTTRAARTALALLAIATIALSLNHSRLRARYLTGPTDVERRLASRLDEVRFDDVPLRDAVESITLRAGLTSQVDWPQLEADLGLDPGAPVRLRLYDATVAQALDVVLREARDTLGHLLRVPLQFETKGNALAIDHPQGLSDRCGVFRAYDVRDLIEADVRFSEDIRPDETLEAGLERVQREWEATNADDARSSSLFVSGPAEAFDVWQVPASVAEDYVSLTTAVGEEAGRDFARPEVLYRSGHLIVRARPAAHAKISWLLAELRRSGPPKRVEPPESEGRDQ